MWPFQHPWIVATPSQILDKTHHSESFIPWGTECTPQDYQFNVENNDKPLAVGYPTFGQNYLSIRKPALPNIWQSRYLTHPRLGNQPLTLHGSADLLMWARSWREHQHQSPWVLFWGLSTDFGESAIPSNGLKPPRYCHLQHTMHPRSPHFRPAKGKGCSVFFICFDGNLRKYKYWFSNWN